MDGDQSGKLAETFADSSPLDKCMAIVESVFGEAEPDHPILSSKASEDITGNHRLDYLNGAKKVVVLSNEPSHIHLIGPGDKAGGDRQGVNFNRLEIEAGVGEGTSTARIQRIKWRDSESYFDLYTREKMDKSVAAAFGNTDEAAEAAVGVITQAELLEQLAIFVAQSSPEKIPELKEAIAANYTSIEVKQMLGQMNRYQSRFLEEPEPAHHPDNEEYRQQLDGKFAAIFDLTHDG